MDVPLSHGELFDGLSQDGLQKLLAIGRPLPLQADEYLCRLGDDASDCYVLVKGHIDLCFPMRLGGAVKDITVESVEPGQAMGWSALVKPHRFTLSARAIEPSEVIRFARKDLLELFKAEPAIGYAFFTKISEIVSIRLHTFQALWVRELQRALEAETQRRGERSSASQ